MNFEFGGLKIQRVAICHVRLQIIDRFKFSLYLWGEAYNLDGDTVLLCMTPTVCSSKF